jgi:hypothetical protein
MEEEMFGDDFEDWSYASSSLKRERPPSPFPFPMAQENSEDSDNSVGKMKKILYVHIGWSRKSF